MATITELGVIGLSLVAVLLIAVNGVRPSRGPRSARDVASYPEPSSGTHGLLVVFCLFAFADGYRVIAPGSRAAQVGACLGLVIALMPSLELTGTILSVLAAVTTVLSFAQTGQGVLALLGQVSLAMVLLTGRLIGRVFAGPSRRRASHLLVVGMAEVGLITFLVSPAGQSIVGGTTERIATSTAVAFAAGIAFAMPGILIPALVGIAVSTTTLLLTAGNIDGSGHSAIELTFLACAGTAYTLVKIAANTLPGRRRRTPQTARW